MSGVGRRQSGSRAASGMGPERPGPQGQERVR